MANALCYTPVNSFKSPSKPELFIGNSIAGKVLRIDDVFPNSRNAKFQSVEAKAAESNKSANPGSIICADCDGNGNSEDLKVYRTIVHLRVICMEDDLFDKITTFKSPNVGDCLGAKLCSQCKGSGVNSVDHFNGRFKAGGVCWLCGGKKDILCGNCNGAGFMGGFLSTHDE